MNESNLKKLYNKADAKKLVSMFDKSIAYNKQASILSEKAESIVEHVEETVIKRFKKIDDVSEIDANEQLSMLSKQWSIMSASIVKTKYSIPLNGFHSSIKLWINPEYGIKEYKRHVRYSPFDHNEFGHKLNDRKSFNFINEKLFINDSWDRGYIDFVALRNIPQIDQNRIYQFIGITKDIIYMIGSWRNYFGAGNKQQVSMLQDIKNMSMQYRTHDPIDFRRCLIQLDTMIAFKKKLSIGLVKQTARWELIIQKWKTVNKNFLVLNELRNSKLKI